VDEADYMNKTADALKQAQTVRLALGKIKAFRR